MGRVLTDSPLQISNCRLQIDNRLRSYPQLDIMRFPICNLQSKICNLKSRLEPPLPHLPLLQSLSQLDHVLDVYRLILR